jgi:hypothetical protein
MRSPSSIKVKEKKWKVSLLILPHSMCIRRLAAMRLIRTNTIALIDAHKYWQVYYDLEHVVARSDHAPLVGLLCRRRRRRRRRILVFFDRNFVTTQTYNGRGGVE